MLYEAIHRMRLWLWKRQEKALARDARPTGTSDGDWIGATVAASIASSGAGAQHAVSYVDGGSCGGSSGNC